MKTSNKQSLWKLVVGACVLFVWFMGVNGLTRVPLATHDEARTLVHVFGHSLDMPQPLYLTAASVADESAQHGPLYFLLLNVWAGLAGADLFTLRLLSVYFAVLSLAAVCLLAGMTRSGRVSSAAVAILALNWLFIFYARELRMYTLLPGLVAWNIWCYWRALKTKENVTWRVWFGLAVSAALILYLHYFTFFVLAAVGVYHCVFVRKGKTWLKVAAAYAIAGVLFVPWLPVLLKGYDQFSGKSLSGMDTIESVASILGVFSNDAWVIAAGLIVVIIWRRKLLNETERFLLILTLLSMAGILIGNVVGSILVANRLRYFLVFGPLLACSLAIGWRLIPKGRLPQLIFAAAWLMAFFVYANDDQSYVAAKRKSIAADQTPPYYSFLYNSHIDAEQTDAILSLHPSLRITWITSDYYQKRIGSAHLVHIHYNKHGSLRIQTTKKQLDSLDQFVATYDSFWLVYNPLEVGRDSMAEIFGWMRRYYRSCGKALDEALSVIERFVRDSDPC